MIRWARRVLLCIVVGAGLNVLVAWAILFNAAHVPAAYPFAETGETGGAWPIAPPSTWPREWGRRLRISTQFGIEIESFSKTRYSEYGDSVSMAVLRCGWPMRSLKRGSFGGSTDVESAEDSEVSRWFREGVELPARAKRLITYPVSWWLPVRPIWGGFVVNTGVFGGGVGAVWGLCAAARRGRRRLAGRCVTCGYELAGLSRCPECGAGA